MNPFLECPGIWPAFHHQLVAALHQDLVPKLGEHYEARIGERRYTAEPAPGAPGTGVKQCEEYVEIHKANGGGLVTLVDVVSPPNKTTESGRWAYLDTRQRARDLKANLVDLDLVLQGQPTLDYSPEGLPDWDYAVTVSRSMEPDRLEIYTATLHKRLPRFRLPVVAMNPDIVIDLQNMFMLAYERGGFAGQIDYRYEPDGGMKNTSRRRLRELFNLTTQPTETGFTHDEIALAAYFIWKEQGCPEGRADQHWRLAIERLKQDRKVSGQLTTPSHQ
jgi:hypothetical protein